MELVRPADDKVFGEALTRLRAVTAPSREVPGWATVDLARTEQAALGQLRQSPSIEWDLDDVLGASARLVTQEDGRDLVLLEPSTEGRVAAALARHGEGIVALYLLVGADAPVQVRAAGFNLGPPGSGPFGPERLVLGGPRWGPFLIIAGLA